MALPSDLASLNGEESDESVFDKKGDTELDNDDETMTDQLRRGGETCSPRQVATRTNDDGSVSSYESSIGNSQSGMLSSLQSISSFLGEGDCLQIYASAENTQMNWYFW